MGSFAAMAGYPARPPLTPGFVAIIVFKYVKLAAFVTAGVVVLRAARLPDHSLPTHLARFLEAHPERQAVRSLSELLAGADPVRMAEIGAALIAVGLIFGTEGTLLMFRVWWATYLTITLTGLAVPLEVMEIVRHPGNVRLYVLLAVNLAIFVFLWRRRNEFRRVDAPAG